MVAISVPSDWLFVKIDVNLLGLQILFNAPRAEFAPEAGLLVTSPRSLHVSRLHVVDPDDSSTQRLHRAECLEDVARPHCSSQSIGRIISNFHRVFFVFE